MSIFLSLPVALCPGLLMVVDLEPIPAQYPLLWMADIWMKIPGFPRPSNTLNHTPSTLKGGFVVVRKRRFEIAHILYWTGWGSTLFLKFWFVTLVTKLWPPQKQSRTRDSSNLHVRIKLVYVRTVCVAILAQVSSSRSDLFFSSCCCCCCCCCWYLITILFAGSNYDKMKNKIYYSFFSS